MNMRESVKVVSSVLKDNKDTIAQVGKVGVSEVVKHKGKSDAKQRYGDYLAFKSSGETDIEKFAYDRSQTSGRDWDEICENIRFHVNKNGASAPVVPMNNIPVQQLIDTPTPKPVTTIEAKAVQLVRTKEFMNAAGMLELFDSPSLTSTDVAVMFQVISDDLRQRGAAHQLHSWEMLRNKFEEFAACKVSFTEWFKEYAPVFREVYDVYDKPTEDLAQTESAVAPRTNNMDIQTAWKSVEIARCIKLSQNNGVHLTEEDWRQVHLMTTALLERRRVTGDILGVWESLRDRWDMVRNPTELSFHEVGTMQEIYNYVQILSYGGSMESVVEEIFSMFPAMESEDFRKLDPKDGALLFACKKLKELI